MSAKVIIFEREAINQITYIKKYAHVPSLSCQKAREMDGMVVVFTNTKHSTVALALVECYWASCSTFFFFSLFSSGSSATDVTSFGSCAMYV